MTAAMACRGPDGINHWQGEGAALGHCLLQTTPESLEEQQPVTNEDTSLVLVMDGRVDNRADMSKELLANGAILRNRSDPELLLRAYQRWGENCLTRIEGDFAFAVWHVNERRLFCARDPLGNRPFHYYWSGRSLVFATDLHAILALPEVPQVPNEGVLAEYLASEWYSRDETFWRGVLRLVAAHRMVVDASGPKIEQHWSPELFATLNYKRDEDYIEHYLELLTVTVRRLSRSYRPLACEVSGGLDSSAIFAVAEQLRRRGELLAPELAGYTMNFEGDPDADEIAFCRAVGEHLNRPITELPPFLPPLDWYRDKARQFRQFPGMPNGVMAGALMQRASEQGSRVLFNGVGGDEWLGAGRHYYLEELAAGNWRQFTRLLQQDAVRQGLPKSLWHVLRHGIAPALPDAAKEQLRRVRDWRSHKANGRHWLAPPLRDALKQQQARHYTPAMPCLRWSGQRNELAMLRDPYTILAHELHELFAASYGLELRRPFYTTAMVQFSFAVPKRMLFAGGVNRYCHRQALVGLLPDSVLQRKSKAEFSVTYRHYLSAMQGLLTGEIPARRPDWIDQQCVEAVFENHASLNEESAECFSLWMLFGCDNI
jgi:asparagine synthase (glutamine-hydrolysing)